MPQPAWLVYGPPGCGKTTWILAQVKAARRKLFHWNARTDRTLREGRESLHQQVYENHEMSGILKVYYLIKDFLNKF